MFISNIREICSSYHTFLFYFKMKSIKWCCLNSCYRHFVGRIRNKNEKRNLINILKTILLLLCFKLNGSYKNIWIFKTKFVSTKWKIHRNLIEFLMTINAYLLNAYSYFYLYLWYILTAISERGKNLFLLLHFTL